jgi:hypothetical protein
MARQVSVRTFATRDEGEIAQGLLESAGIDSWLATDDAGGAYPFQFSGGAHLMVGERDLEEATRILTDTPGIEPGSSTGATGDEAGHPDA